MARDMEMSLAEALHINNVVIERWAHTDGEDQLMKSVDYSRLVSVLLPAVSELTKQINELKSQLHTNEAWVS